MGDGAGDGGEFDFVGGGSGDEGAFDGGWNVYGNFLALQCFDIFVEKEKHA